MFIADPALWARVACVAAAVVLSLSFTAARAADEPAKIAVEFEGGHELGRNDYGRPCALIAAGIGVETDVFREAFKNVKPAKGRRPTGEEQRRNKEIMMRVLAPHGVTNERLDAVADYYRFRPQDGELWPTRPAKAYALIASGRVTKIVITDPGSGYNTPPRATIPGHKDLLLTVTLHLDKSLPANGGIEKIELTPNKPKH